MTGYLKRVYEFPIATMTSYHKLSGLKQHKTSGSQKSEADFMGQNQGVRKAAFLSTGSRGESGFCWCFVFCFVLFFAFFSF